MRDYEQDISPKPVIEPREEQVPYDYAAPSLLQNTLLRVLSALETMGQAGSPADTSGTSHT